jgi:hypothetical protein
MSALFDLEKHTATAAAQLQVAYSLKKRKAINMWQMLMAALVTVSFHACEPGL